LRWIFAADTIINNTHEEVRRTMMNNSYGHQMVSTKANTLYALSKVITKSRIEKMYILPVAEYVLAEI